MWTPSVSASTLPSLWSVQTFTSPRGGTSGLDLHHHPRPRHRHLRRGRRSGAVLRRRGGGRRLRPPPRGAEVHQRPEGTGLCRGWGDQGLLSSGRLAGGGGRGRGGALVWGKGPNAWNKKTFGKDDTEVDGLSVVVILLSGLTTNWHTKAVYGVEPVSVV